MTAELLTEVKNHLQVARLALAAERFAQATVAVSLASLAAHRLPQAHKQEAQHQIAQLARQIEIEYRLYLRRKEMEREEARRRQQLDRQKQQTAVALEKPVKQVNKEKPSVKIEKTDVRAQVVATTQGVAVLKVTSAKLGSAIEAKQVAQALKNKPVMQIGSPSLRHPAQPRRLKLQLGQHRHALAARVHKPHKNPTIHIGSIS